MHRPVAALSTSAAAITLAVGLASCSSAPPDLAAADLEDQLTQSLNDEGAWSATVSCADDLHAKVGSSVRCQVEFSPSDRVQAVITTTSVTDGQIDYEVLPNLTRRQVETRVAAMASAQSAECDSGLDGSVGDWTQCVITKDGKALERTVEVNRVNGLRLGLEAVGVLNREQLAKALSQKLTASAGGAPESVECSTGLLAKKGATADCVATYDRKRTAYTVAFKPSAKGGFQFDYFLKGQEKPTTASPTGSKPANSSPTATPPPAPKPPASTPTVAPAPAPKPATSAPASPAPRQPAAPSPTTSGGGARGEQ